MLTFNQLFDLVPDEDADETEIMFRYDGVTLHIKNVAIENDLETDERLIVLS